MNPEEVNGTPQWTRLNDEMLEHYYQKSIEEKVYKRKYDEAALLMWCMAPFPMGLTQSSSVKK